MFNCIFKSVLLPEYLGGNILVKIYAQPLIFNEYYSPNHIHTSGCPMETLFRVTTFKNVLLGDLCCM